MLVKMTRLASLPLDHRCTSIVIIRWKFEARVIRVSFLLLSWLTTAFIDLKMGNYNFGEPIACVHNRSSLSY